MPQDKTRSRLFLKDGCTEFVETKELKDPLAVEVEHSQIIGLVQIALDRVKMPAVALPSLTASQKKTLRLFDRANATGTA